MILRVRTKTYAGLLRRDMLWTVVTEWGQESDVRQHGILALQCRLFFKNFEKILDSAC